MAQLDGGKIVNINAFFVCFKKSYLFDILFI